jgi:dihydroorotate dehydrogenase
VSTGFDGAVALLRRLPAETAHRATLALLEFGGPLIAQSRVDDPRLAVSALGLQFPNSIGLAAGFDKDARVFRAMLKLGFGFVECGTVTPRPQSGNPKPRLFRLVDDQAVVNRMGFNNSGAASVAARLRSHSGIVGINIGANRDSEDRIVDYRSAFASLAPYADYIAVNVSSPNTPGLRNLQTRDELARLLATLTSQRASQIRRVPILVKIAPDISLSVLDQITETALAAGIEGLIVSNTTVERPPSLQSRYALEGGGLSGAPLFAPSTALLKETYKRVGGRLVLIGVGGIFSGADAYAKIRAGATLVQLYTGLALKGPGLLQQIKRDLLAHLERDGLATVGGAVGIDTQAGASVGQSFLRS